MERSHIPEFCCKSHFLQFIFEDVDDLGLFCKPKTPSACAAMAVKPDDHEADSRHKSESGLHHKKDAAVRTESKVSYGFQSKASSMDSNLSCGIDPVEAVSTELTLSCGPVQIEAKKRKAPELARAYSLLFPHENHEGVSTELNLFDESWIDPKRPTKTLNLFKDSVLIDSKKNETVLMENSAINPKKDSPVSLNSEVTVMSSNINAVIARAGSVRLVKDDLYDVAEIRTPTAMDDDQVDPWKIKKTLTESDLGNLSRLLLKKTWVMHHVLPLLNPDMIREVESDKGTQVMVWDQDSQSAHELVLKKWKTCKGYVLIKGWHEDFVNRRNLKKGDVIGLYWVPSDSIFYFSVLRRADLQGEDHHQPNDL